MTKIPQIFLSKDRFGGNVVREETMAIIPGPLRAKIEKTCFPAVDVWYVPDYMMPYGNIGQNHDM